MHIVSMYAVISCMHKFQQERGVKDQCVTNTQFLYDTIKHNYEVDVKARACVVLSQDIKNKELKVIIHLVLTVKDQIIDSSYDVFSLEDKHYYFNIASFSKAIKDITLPFEFQKKYLTIFLKFLDFAKKINEGQLIITDKQHYTDQADFVEAASGNRGGGR